MCNCNKNVPVEREFVVTAPNGSTTVVQGETAAKIKVTTNGGGSYEAKTR